MAKRMAPGLAPAGAYPAVGVIFTLPFDPALSGYDSIGIVKDLAGYGNWQSWQFEGDALTDILTGNFKLVSVGDCRDAIEVREKLESIEPGRIIVPSGQWIAAFRAAYPNHDYRGNVGIADPSWVIRERSFFPYIEDSSGVPLLWRGVGVPCFKRWRWLVQVIGAEKEVETPTT